MAATDALPVPIYGVNYRVYFALRLNTGAVNSGAAGVTTKVSKDGATFATAGNSPAEIATSSGIYYLDLTSGEMTARCTAVLVTSSTSGAVPKEIFLYPQQAGDIPVDIDTINGDGNASLIQQHLLNAVLQGAVDTSTLTATVTDFECNLGATFAAGFFNGRTVLWDIAGALGGQAARITGTSTTHSKLHLTVTALTAAPANGATFYIV